jgi:DNA-binding MarR family transcriptional regulator
MTMDKNREDIMQTLIQRMMSVMRHVKHGGMLPGVPALSPPQVHLLFIIAAGKEAGISVKDLAERSSVTPGAITQFVDGLVEQRLVAREGDPNDRRIVRLKLTDLAKSQFENFRKEHLASMFKIFEALTDEEIKQLIALFTKMDAYHEMKDPIIVKTD